MHLVLFAIYVLALTILSVFGLYGLVMVIIYLRLKPKDPDPGPPVAEEDLPLVTVQLPVFNERYVVERLVDAVCRLDWPQDRLEIQLLDDSTDDTVALSRSIVERKQAEGFRIEVLHRTDRSGYKAGALQAGLAVSKGEYVAIFDADFIPDPGFLRDTVPHLLSNPDVGMVQARWEHLNRDYSLITRVQAMALDAHFAMEQQIRNRARVFMNFNGTAGVWRKACIIDAGDWHSDTLTEDLDLSYRAQLRGWRFLYLNEVSVPAELPAEVNGLKLQQLIENLRTFSAWRAKSGTLNLVVFAMRQRRAFAGCAHRHQPVRTLLNMPLDQFFQRIEIQLAVRERRDKSRQRPFDHDTHPKLGGKLLPVDYWVLSGVFRLCQVCELRQRRDKLPMCRGHPFGTTAL